MKRPLLFASLCASLIGLVDIRERARFVRLSRVFHGLLHFLLKCVCRVELVSPAAAPVSNVYFDTPVDPKVNYTGEGWEQWGRVSRRLASVLSVLGGTGITFKTARMAGAAGGCKGGLAHDQ